MFSFLRNLWTHVIACFSPEPDLEAGISPVIPSLDSPAAFLVPMAYPSAIQYPAMTYDSKKTHAPGCDAPQARIPEAFCYPTSSYSRYPSPSSLSSASCSSNLSSPPPPSPNTFPQYYIPPSSPLYSTMHSLASTSTCPSLSSSPAPSASSASTSPPTTPQMKNALGLVFDTPTRVLTPTQNSPSWSSPESISVYSPPDSDQRRREYKLPPPLKLNLSPTIPDDQLLSPSTPDRTAYLSRFTGRTYSHSTSRTSPSPSSPSYEYSANPFAARGESFFTADARRDTSEVIPHPDLFDFSVYSAAASARGRRKAHAQDLQPPTGLGNGVAPTTAAPEVSLPRSPPRPKGVSVLPRSTPYDPEPSTSMHQPPSPGRPLESALRNEIEIEAGAVPPAKGLRPLVLPERVARRRSETPPLAGPSRISSSAAVPIRDSESSESVSELPYLAPSPPSSPLFLPPTLPLNIRKKSAGGTPPVNTSPLPPAGAQRTKESQTAHRDTAKDSKDDGLEPVKSRRMSDLISLIDVAIINDAIQKAPTVQVHREIDPRQPLSLQMDSEWSLDALSTPSELEEDEWESTGAEDLEAELDDWVHNPSYRVSSHLEDLLRLINSAQDQKHHQPITDERGVPGCDSAVSQGQDHAHVYEYAVAI